MQDKRRKATTPGSEPAPAAETSELPERWSRRVLVLAILPQ